MFIGTYQSNQPGFTKLYIAVGTFDGFVRSEIMESMKKDGFTEAQLSKVWTRIQIQKMPSGVTARGQVWSHTEVVS